MTPYSSDAYGSGSGLAGLIANSKSQLTCDVLSACVPKQRFSGFGAGCHRGGNEWTIMAEVSSRTIRHAGIFHAGFDVKIGRGSRSRWQNP